MRSSDGEEHQCSFIRQYDTVRYLHSICEYSGNCCHGNWPSHSLGHDKTGKGGFRDVVLLVGKPWCANCNILSVPLGGAAVSYGGRLDWTTRTLELLGHK